jgi:CheY-like chemotaxis protein
MARVLVVDDEPGIRELLRDELRDLGHEVLEAADGLEGFALYRKARPDLIVSDVRMPRQDGLAMVREIRSEDSAVPILLITGFADVTAAEAGALAITAVLPKPFDLEAFGAALRSCL